MSKHAVVEAEAPASAPTETRTFLGVQLQCPLIYSPGHVLTETEANGLNSFIISYLGNGFSGLMRRAAEKEGVAPSALAWDFQAEFDDFISTYRLGETQRRGEGPAAVDPVAKAAQTIATAKIKELLKAKGHNIANVLKAKAADGSSVFHTMVAQYIERNPWVQDLAESQVEAMNSHDDGEDIFADLGTVTDEAA